MGYRIPRQAPQGPYAPHLEGATEGGLGLGGVGEGRDLLTQVEDAAVGASAVHVREDEGEEGGGGFLCAEGEAERGAGIRGGA